MKDQLLEELLSYVKGTKDFILEQAPDLFNQIIRFELISSIWFAGIFGSIFIACVFLCRYAMNSEDDDAFLGIISLIGGLISLIIFVCSIYDIIFVCCAPKYYLIKLLLGLGK